MKVLLDECLDQRLRHDLPGHDVSTVGYMGWGNSRILDPALVRLAEQAGFEVFVAVDCKRDWSRLSTVLGFIVFKSTIKSTYDVLHPLMPKVLAELPPCASRHRELCHPIMCYRRAASSRPLAVACYLLGRRVVARFPRQDAGHHPNPT